MAKDPRARRGNESADNEEKVKIEELNPVLTPSIQGSTPGLITRVLPGLSEALWICNNSSSGY